jgi:type II secretory pathway pseudopilin PulG
VAVIAVLAALLLPALQNAKQSGIRARCVSQLQQIGLACHSYANDYDTFFPVGNGQGIRFLPAYTRDAFNSILQRNSAVFYCPNISFQDPTYGPTNWNTTVVSGFSLTPIGYIYTANPNNGPSDDIYWLDVNGNGSRRDEYLVSLRDPNPASIPICVDNISQVPTSADWLFPHPPRQGTGSMNELFGDGHVETKQSKQIINRWGVPSAWRGW